MAPTKIVITRDIQAKMLLWHEDVWYEIFSYLNFDDLLEASVVCSSWRKLIVPRLRRKSFLHLMAENVPTIANYLWKIEDLTPSYCFKCSGVMLEYMDKNVEYILSRIGPYVSNITLMFSPVTMHTKQVLAEFLPNLENLKLRVITAEEEWYLQSFPKLKALFVLSIGTSRDAFSPVNPRLMNLNRLNHLEDLHLNFYFNDDDIALGLLEPRAQYLRSVTICLTGRCKVYKWTRLWPKFRSLQSLKFSIVSAKNDDIRESLVNGLPNSAPLRNLVLDPFHWDENLFQRFLQKWPHKLRSLQCPSCANIKQLTSIQSNLQYLTLMSHDANEDEICLLATSMPFLKELNLSYCRNGVTDKSLSCIFEHGTGLQILILKDCWKITDNAFNGICPQPAGIRRLQCLKKLDLSGCWRITDITVISSLKFPQLESIDLSENHNISKEAISILQWRCPTIKYITLKNCLKIPGPLTLCITGRRLSIPNL